MSEKLDTQPTSIATPTGDFMAFLVAAAVSIAGIYISAGLCANVLDQLMRYEAVDLVRAVAGVA